MKGADEKKRLQHDAMKLLEDIKGHRAAVKAKLGWITCTEAA
jgi:hypothetical protein